MPNGDEIFDAEPSQDRKYLRDLATAEPIHKTIREFSTEGNVCIEEERVPGY